MSPLPMKPPCHRMSTVTPNESVTRTTSPMNRLTREAGVPLQKSSQQAAGTTAKAIAVEAFMLLGRSVDAACSRTPRTQMDSGRVTVWLWRQDGLETGWTAKMATPADFAALASSRSFVAKDAPRRIASSR